MGSYSKNPELIAERFATLLNTEVTIQKDDSEISECSNRFCSKCKRSGCNPEKIFKYGIREAFRWQGKYVYYCPAGFTFVAACTVRKEQLTGGITVGPFIPDEYYEISDNLKDSVSDEVISLIPRISSNQADALSFILLDAIQTEIIDSNTPNIYTHYTRDMCEAQQADIAFKIKKYLREHFEEKISLQDIALQVYLSKNYVSTLFNEQTGCGINEYLNAVRIDNACRLMRETTLSLSEISQKCGFEGQSYFNRVFKKSLCCSPVQYRKSPTPEKKAHN